MEIGAVQTPVSPLPTRNSQLAGSRKSANEANSMATPRLATAPNRIIDHFSEKSFAARTCSTESRIDTTM